jgi:hypothetical protein
MNTVQRKAIELARALKPDDFPCRTFHITALFERTKLICVGQNNPRTHAKNVWNNRNKFDLGLKSTCSELDAVLKAKKRISNLDWKRITMVNVRINRGNKVDISCPCSSCQSLLAYIRPGKVFFTTEKGNFAEY